MTCLILFVPITTNAFIFVPWLVWHDDRNLLLWLGPFNFGVVFILINYFLSIVTDAGTVPSGYLPSLELDYIWAQAEADNKKISKTESLDDSTINHSEKKSSLRKRKNNKKHSRNPDKWTPSNSIPNIFQQGIIDDNLQKSSIFIKEPVSPELIEKWSNLAKSKLKPKWCHKCQHFKPPRTHHSSAFGKCILRMDHYCPWVDNCVGFGNHAHFYRFLGSVVWSSFACLSLLAIRVLDLLKYQNQMDNFSNLQSVSDTLFYTPPIGSVETIFMVINLIILFGLLFTVGILFVFQTFYLLGNASTVEIHENGKIESLVEKGKLKEEDIGKYPYDLGWYENVKSILGNNPLFWFVPFVKSPGNGLLYKIRDDLNIVNYVQWPPREYYFYKKYPYGKSKSNKKTKKRRDINNDERIKDIDHHKNEVINKEVAPVGGGDLTDDQRLNRIRSKYTSMDPESIKIIDHEYVIKEDPFITSLKQNPIEYNREILESLGSQIFDFDENSVYSRSERGIDDIDDLNFEPEVKSGLSVEINKTLNIIKGTDDDDDTSLLKTKEISKIVTKQTKKLTLVEQIQLRNLEKIHATAELSPQIDSLKITEVESFLNKFDDKRKKEILNSLVDFSDAGLSLNEKRKNGSSSDEISSSDTEEDSDDDDKKIISESSESDVESENDQNSITSLEKHPVYKRFKDESISDFEFDSDNNEYVMNPKQNAYFTQMEKEIDFITDTSESESESE